MDPIGRRSCVLAALALLATAGGAVTIHVDTNLDFDVLEGDCSLREAIVAANTDAAHQDCPSGSGEDHIIFDLVGLVVIQLNQDLPPVTASLAIRAADPAHLTIDGQDTYGIFTFDTPAGNGRFVIDGLTLTRGVVHPATPYDVGGAVFVAAGERVYIDRVVFQSNQSLDGGGALGIFGAPGVSTRVEVRRSTFNDNVAHGGLGGGGIFVYRGEIYVAESTLYANRALYWTGSGGGLRVDRSAAVVESSTFSANRAALDGGGISAFTNDLSSSAASLTLERSTLVDNGADADFDGSGEGGGLSIDAAGGAPAVELRAVDNILALNLNFSLSLAPSVAGGPPIYSDVSMGLADADLITTGWNLVGNNTGGSALFPAGNPNAQGNYVGTSAAQIDPRLEPLADNGGPTQTHRPLLEASSPVIDQGACANVAADQRGWGSGPGGGRIFDHGAVVNGSLSDGCDIGAVERGASPKAESGLLSSDFESVTLLFWSNTRP